MTRSQREYHACAMRWANAGTFRRRVAAIQVWRRVRRGGTRRGRVKVVRP